MANKKPRSKSGKRKRGSLSSSASKGRKSNSCYVKSPHTSTPISHVRKSKQNQPSQNDGELTGINASSETKTSSFSSNVTGNHEQEKVTEPMSHQKISELVEKSRNEVLLTILNKNSGFDVLLSQSGTDGNSMAYVLRVLYLAVTSDLRFNVTSLITSIISNERFFLINLPRYLAAFQKCENIQLISLLYLTAFLKTCQHFQPLLISDYLLILLPLIKATCEKALKCSEFYGKVSEHLEKIEQRNNNVIQKHYVAFKVKSQRKKLRLQSPQGGARSIATLPTIEDIRQPSLPPNLTEGRYKDAKSYLDFQYNTLENDYMNPLREGIKEYLEYMMSGTYLNSCQGIRIYQDVLIKRQAFVNGYFVHIAKFNINDFLNIKWECSKRFLTGSLVCLSFDNFKTILFASVARRNLEELQKGLLLLRFEDVANEILNLSPQRRFTLIETDVYFEIFKNNLSALKEMDAAKLPFKKYLVDKEIVASKPQYLLENTTYNFGPLLLEEKTTKEQLKCDGKVLCEPEIPDISGPSPLPVLTHTAWPSSAELGLDPSQYAAMQTAITNEFALIRGPPGTGKTFIALRIIQLLLHNADKWNDNNNSPILVVCKTNNALDYFMEKLLPFTRKIALIGSRSNRKTISKFHLKNLKSSARLKVEIPNYVSDSIREKCEDLRNLHRDVTNIKRSLDSCFTTVLTEINLQPYISQIHYNSLLKSDVIDYGLLIHYWLGVNISGDIDLSNIIADDFETGEEKTQVSKSSETWEVSVSQVTAATNSFLDTSTETEHEKEDIESLEGERNVNMEDFSNIFDDILTEENPVALINDTQSTVPENVTKQLQDIKKYLINTAAMEESYSRTVEDVWKLDVTSRWQMYKLWLQKFIEEKQKEHFRKQQQFETQWIELKEMLTEEDMHVLRSATIVGITAVGINANWNLVQRLNPQIILVEEATEIMEYELITCLSRNTKHLILIGNDEQSFPKPQAFAINSDLKVSLLKRMVNNGMKYCRLTYQHRMRPDIVSLLVPLVYEEDLENSEPILKYKSIKGICNNIYFVCPNTGKCRKLSAEGKYCENEAKFLVQLCKYFLLQGYESSRITLLTTNYSQCFAVKKYAKIASIKNVRISVIDHFQGEENDIVLISFARCNEDEIDSSKNLERVFVALSRAKMGLYCIGNFNYFAKVSKVWQKIVDKLYKMRVIGLAFEVLCKDHRDVHNFVSNEKDLDIINKGNCPRPCKFRLPCGHTCPLLCHLENSAHRYVRCEKTCEKACRFCQSKCNHKCYLTCSPCTNFIIKQYPTCSHTYQGPCNVLVWHFNRCEKPCEKKLPCGHECQNRCCDPCEVKCFTEVVIKLDACGHKVTITCFHSHDAKYLVKICKKPCKSKLACGHICKGTCGKCYQRRLHVICREPCKRILICGHKCRSICYKSCPPCKRACENLCFHRKCPKKCGEPCVKCDEPCALSCAHEKCTRLCGDPCSRLPCNEPCPKLLKCKHPCIGFCGEPCPKQCRVCHRDKVKESFFGFENEKNATFILLEDCNHIFENKGFMRWISKSRREGSEIVMKTCPKCGTVIRRNWRYESTIKSCLERMEKVKSITYGDNKNPEIQISLLNKIPKTKSITSVLRSLMQVLSSKRIRSMQELTAMDNVINISIQLMEATDGLLDSSMYLNKSPVQVRNNVSQLVDYCNLSLNILLLFIKNKCLLASQQQLLDLSWEVHRLKLAKKLLIFVKDLAIKHPNAYFKSLVNCLTNYARFRIPEVEKFSSNFQNLAQQFGIVIRNLTEIEKPTPLRALDLSQGHWYQCPNGHVYCITVHARAAAPVVECKECNAAPGDTEDKLISKTKWLQIWMDLDTEHNPAQ